VPLEAPDGEEADQRVCQYYYERYKQLATDPKVGLDGNHDFNLNVEAKLKSWINFEQENVINILKDKVNQLQNIINEQNSQISGLTAQLSGSIRQQEALTFKNTIKLRNLQQKHVAELETQKQNVRRLEAGCRELRNKCGTKHSTGRELEGTLISKLVMENQPKELILTHL